MKKNGFHYAITATGILLLGIGLFLVISCSNPQGIMVPLPYICIGVGCGIFGGGMGDIISRRVLKNNPDIQRKIEIEKNDERNVTIANRAKARAYDMMVFVFGVLMLSFALMGVNMIAILLLVFSYLLIIGCSIFYRCRYDKQM